MAMIRWEPFQDADVLRYRLNKLFDGMDATRVSSWTRQETWLPAIELREDEENVMLQVALPGIDPENIDIQVSQKAVLITGMRPESSAPQQEALVATELLYGQFRRVIPLNAMVQNGKTHAKFEHGMLTLTMPKAESERNRVFKVHLTDSGQTNVQMTPPMDRTSMESSAEHEIAASQS